MPLTPDRRFLRNHDDFDVATLTTPYEDATHGIVENPDYDPEADDPGKQWGRGTVASGGGSNAAFTALVGDGTTTAFPLNHALSSQALAIEVWDLSGTDPALEPNDGSVYSVVVDDDDNVTVTFVSAPATDEARVVILAAGGTTGGGGSGPSLLVQDEKAQNTAGGTFTSGDWRTRTLNTVKVNEITGASLASNQVTLPAGTYDAVWSAPCFSTGNMRHQTRLYNVTDAEVIAPGSSQGTFTSATTRSMGDARFTLAASKVIELQHRCQTTQSNNGFGVESNFGTEVYAILRIRKVG